MDYLEKIKQELANIVNEALNTDMVSSVDFVYPPNKEMGDLALPLFALAPKFQKNPVQLAQELATKITATDFFCVQAAGPYLNFSLSATDLVKKVIETVENKTIHYGTNNDGRGQEVMIEYSNINTHKEYHLGHLRNIAYGDAANRLYAALGWKVWPVSYVNDFGIHTAKTIWAWQQSAVSQLENEDDEGYLLGQVYVESVNKLKDNVEGEKEVSAIMQSIEARQGESYELWQKTRAWSLDYFARIYNELGIDFKEFYYESDYIDEGRRLVDELLTKGILKKSEGAVIADLEEYGLGVLVLLRSDGTATYPVADLALASEKFKRHQLSQSLYVVDNRQTLYFKQLFKILELMGYKAEMKHLAYDFVKLPSGMMSSRSGNTITFKDLHLAIFEKLKSEIMERHNDWEEAQIVSTASKLTIGVLKFEMLKVGADKVITFSVDDALKFDGFTSIYLQYTGARISSILRKAEVLPVDLSALTDKKEKQLVLNLAKYPEVLREAQSSCNPSVVAKYLFDLSKDFNDYYHDVNILSAAEPMRLARLHLITAVRQVLTNGLNILGIELVEQM